MTTASQQLNIPTWKEVIGNALLVEYELKFDVNFSQRKHIYFITLRVCVRTILMKKHIELKFAHFLYDVSLFLKYDDVRLFSSTYFLRS